MKHESYGRLLLGLATGTAFGFLLHKGRAAKHEAITRQLLMADNSVFKIMATASAVGAAGTYALKEMGWADLSIKPLNTGGIIAGGTLFGTGMALLGYCPGTSLAAIGAGHRDAAVGALGMACGALAYVKASPYLEPLITAGAAGKKTLPELTHSSPWFWVAGLAGATALSAAILENQTERQDYACR